MFADDEWYGWSDGVIAKRLDLPYQAGNRFGVAPHALDAEAAERLWALSEETTGVSL